MDIRQIVKENPILAVIRNVPIEKTIDYASAIMNGGIKFFEVALNSPHGVEQIKMLTDKFKDNAIIGGGTAITVEKAKAAVEAGAKFLLTPSTHEDVLQYCKKNDIPLIPGVYSPTDVAVCLRNGFTTLKLFPAGDLPMHYIKSLNGPLDGVEYIALGGVGEDNIKDFFDAGFIGVGIGGKLFPKEYVDSCSWDKASEHVKALVNKIK